MKILSLIFVVGVVTARHKYQTMTSDELDTGEHGIIAGERKTTCNCGWANRFSSRIVGGQGTGVNQYPWMAALVLHGWYPACGATIITEYHVISAGHCTENATIAKTLSVLVGGHTISKDEKSDESQIIQIKSIINHENYIHEGFRNDIALIELQEKIIFSDKVGPACLPTSRNEFNLIDKYIKTLGWGRMKHRGSTSKTLMQVNLRVIPLEMCKEIYFKAKQRMVDYIDINTPTQLCTFSKRKDACQGDSGGPVVYLDPDTNRYTLVGIVSYGKGCATYVPGVQTEVAAYVDWIQNNLKSSNSEGKSCSKI